MANKSDPCDMGHVENQNGRYQNDRYQNDRYRNEL